MSRTSLIKLIHVARRELQLDDDTYRAFLMQKTGKISCRELTVTQLEQVFDAMKESGFKKQNKHPRRRFKGHVTPREKVYKIWRQMAEDGFIADDSDKSAADSLIVLATLATGEMNIERDAHAVLKRLTEGLRNNHPTYLLRTYVSSAGIGLNEQKDHAEGKLGFQSWGEPS